MQKMLPENRLIDKFDMIGKTFSKWTVFEYVGNGCYKARCECGHEAVKQGAELRSMRSSKCFHCRKKELKAVKEFRMANGLCRYGWSNSSAYSIAKQDKPNEQ